jgi:hypothetical protein
MCGQREDGQRAEPEGLVDPSGNIGDVPVVVPPVGDVVVPGVVAVVPGLAGIVVLGVVVVDGDVLVPGVVVVPGVDGVPGVVGTLEPGVAVVPGAAGVTPGVAGVTPGVVGVVPPKLGCGSVPAGTQAPFEQTASGVGGSVVHAVAPTVSGAGPPDDRPFIVDGLVVPVGAGICHTPFSQTNEGPGCSVTQPPAARPPPPPAPAAGGSLVPFVDALPEVLLPCVLAVPPLPVGCTPDVLDVPEVPDCQVPFTHVQPTPGA